MTSVKVDMVYTQPFSVWFHTLIFKGHRHMFVYSLLYQSGLLFMVKGRFDTLDYTGKVFHKLGKELFGRFVY